MCGFSVYTGDLDKLDNFYREFVKIRHRGPDSTQIIHIEKDKKARGAMCFHRLSIRDTSSHGNQPFVDFSLNMYLVCNGEIYNYEKLKEETQKEYHYHSTSDCEVLLPLYKKHGIGKLAKKLDAEFALVIYDIENDKFVAARDPVGIRPLFYGYTIKENKIIFASEAKAIASFCHEVKSFPPGHYFDGEKFHWYLDIRKVERPTSSDLPNILKNIREKLIEGVKKRLVSDVPIGYLLSGGLDSSLVCAIASKLLNAPIETFAIGINVNPIDTKYARQVANFLQSKHHEVLFTEQESLATLDKLIFHLETYDITTIRAAMGMYLLCKYINEKTDIKVVLTGEVSDELFGYKYTDYAPNPQEFQKEAQKRMHEIHMYDVLRADRSISAHALEARVPFGDLDFVNYVMSIPPEIKMNRYNMGKYLLRAAFENENILPKEILFRDKAAFSDAVGHRSVDALKEYAASKYTDKDVQRAQKKYTFAPPFTTESLLYREIFESHFPGQVALVKNFWMPNKSWDNCDVDDPSARVLPNYGKSGS